MLAAVLDLTRRMFNDFKFDPKATTIATPLEQVIKDRRGVCQDFAHFQIGCFRALGLPARYVSGYLETRPPPGKPKLAGADASHAWVQVFIPPAGWVDVDPTNNLLPSDRHVTVAWGRDFDDVSPIRGVIVGGGKHALGVAVDVTPLHESTEISERVTSA
jgi:transglutaminase-like putative cysteine protease